MINIEPPRVYQNALNWGVHHQLKIPFKKSIVYSSFPINKSEIIAITSNSIVRLEKATIKETAPLCLSTAIFIEKQNVIVGVSSTTSGIFFIRPYDLAHHIETNVRTKQVPTFHILYSPKSSLLITAGKNIKIWNLKLIMPSRNTVSVPPVIEITLRSVLDSRFEADLLNPPLFNYQQEQLIIPKSTGFSAYNIDCQFVKQMTKLSTSTRTSAALSNETGNLITFESSEGASYEWNSNGTLLRRNIIGSSSVVSCRYLNSNFVIFLDSKNNLYLYDILTMKFFLCDQLTEKPSSLLLYYTTASFFPTISVCYDNSIDFYEIVVPWKLWRSTMPKPHLIQLCRRHGRASRLLVHTDSEYIYFISPKTQQTVTSSTPSTPSKILGTFYDRGLNSGQQRDQLFTITYDEKLTIFSTSTVPCTEITSIDTSVASVFECNIENKHYYASATTTGEIIVHDYDTFEPIKRYIIVVDKVLCAKYDDKYSTVLLFYEHEIIRVEIASGNVVFSLNMKNVPEIGTVFDFKDELALIGYKSGRISMIKVTEFELINMANDGCVFHNMEVTGFSISTNFFISVSADQQMKFWSFSGSNILTINLPLPLYSVEVINAKRDIVVGTEKDIMLIEGRILFCEKFEQKDDDIDNYNEKNDLLSDDSSSSLYLIEQQKQLLRSAWKENDDQQLAQKPKKGSLYRNKKKEMDEETRRRIIDKMTKMGDDSFTLKRIAERERRRFEEQKNRIQSEVDKERKKRQAEKEEEERKKAQQEEINKLIQKQKEEIENQKRKQQQQLEEEEENHENEIQNEEEERDENDNKNNNNNNPNDNQSQLNESPSYLKLNQFITNQNDKDDEKPPTTPKTPKKKKKKKNKTDPKNNINKTNLVYVDENGKKYRMLDNGDWIDEKGKIYHKNPDGTFVADDGSIFNGPDKNKGHFETADGGRINGQFAPEGTVWISPEGKRYTSLGDGRWIGPDGEILTMGPDGTFLSSDGKKIDGPSIDQIMPEIWIGPDGKVYRRQDDGRYVADDGTVWDKAMDGSAGGYFASKDGSKPGDTFVDENGNVYTRTSEGWIGPDGKLHRIGGDDFLDTSKGQIFRQDGYNGDDVYVAADGSVYKRTPSNRGWIGPDGKIYRLNKDGLFVADDGTVMPLSNERLVWIESSGVSYRPTYEGRRWKSSDGVVFNYESNTKVNDSDGDENVNFLRPRFVSSEGTVWIGPTANNGRFCGKDLFDTAIQWVDFTGQVFKPTTKDGRFWTTTNNNRLFERQPTGEYIEKVESEERSVWGGPGKPSDGNWVNSKGQIIESVGGYWISSDNTIYTGTKNGYISSSGVLYKPVTRGDSFVSQNGEIWNGIGQIKTQDTSNNGIWIDCNGDVYRPADNSGNWIGPEGELYSPQPDGNWVGQSSSKIWKGPPFISARKYFMNTYCLQSFHMPNYRPIPFMPFNIGQRPNTPLYKVPPLLYPPFKSRFKAFDTKSPRRKKRPVVYGVPPPNIVVDASQIVKLINDGNTHLIEVAKRLGLDKNVNNENEHENHKKLIDIKSSGNSNESLPRLVKRFEIENNEIIDDKINCSSSFPCNRRLERASTIDRISKPIRNNEHLPPIQRRGEQRSIYMCQSNTTTNTATTSPRSLYRSSDMFDMNPRSNDQGNIIHPSSSNFVSPRLQYSSNIKNRVPLIQTDQENNIHSSSSNFVSPRLQYSSSTKNRVPLIQTDQENNIHPSSSNFVSPRLQYSSNTKNRVPLIQTDQENNIHPSSTNIVSPRNQSNNNARKREPLIQTDQENNDQHPSSNNFVSPRNQSIGNTMHCVPLIPLDSIEQTTDNSDTKSETKICTSSLTFARFSRNTSSKAVLSHRLSRNGTSTPSSSVVVNSPPPSVSASASASGSVSVSRRFDISDEKNEHSVAHHSQIKNEDSRSTSVIKTECQSKRRLHTAYLSRSYKIHIEKPPNQTSREIVNPLIVKSIVKPKLSVPQQLFKPKKNY